MGKTLLIAALLLATAPACAATVTHCHTHTDSSGDEDKDCESGPKPLTEEELFRSNPTLMARRNAWRAVHCTKVDEWGRLTNGQAIAEADEGGEVIAGVIQETAPIGMRKYEFDQCRMKY